MNIRFDRASTEVRFAETHKAIVRTYFHPQQVRELSRTERFDRSDLHRSNPLNVQCGSIRVRRWLLAFVLYVVKMADYLTFPTAQIR